MLSKRVVVLGSIGVVICSSVFLLLTRRDRAPVDGGQGRDDAGEQVEEHPASVTCGLATAQGTMEEALESRDFEIPHVLPDQIPASLQGVIGVEKGSSFYTRLKAVRSLGRYLNDEEKRTLLSLLNSKAGELGMSLERQNAFKNDIINVLRVQATKTPQLGYCLAAMYEDESHDEVWRDYCIQHLGAWLPNIDDPDERHAAEEAFRRASQETDSSIGGTSLIAMRNAIDDGFKREDVAGKALELSLDPQCGELTKITALQICAELGETGVLPVARELAASKGSVPLRMSAIAAVGTLGDENDREMLEGCSKSSDIRLRTSARSALKRLGKETWRKNVE